MHHRGGVYGGLLSYNCGNPGHCDSQSVISIAIAIRATKTVLAGNTARTLVIITVLESLFELVGINQSAHRPYLHHTAV
jgi:hypothetical protein